MSANKAFKPRMGDEILSPIRGLVIFSVAVTRGLRPGLLMIPPLTGLR